MKKKCPYCGEEIMATAKKCRFCGEWLEKTPENGTRQQPAQQQPTPQQIAAQQAAAREAARQQALAQQQAWAAQQAVQQAMQPQPPQPVYEDNDNEEEESFVKAYFLDSFLKKYADFSTLASRKTFWLTYVAYFVVTLGVAGLALTIGSFLGFTGMFVAYGIIGLFSLATLIPSLGITCRRLRDAGKSPWMILVSMIPVIGSIWLLVLLCQKSTGEHDDEPNVRFLGVDYGIMGGCVALLILGSVLSVKSMAGGFDTGSEYDLGEEMVESVAEEDYQETVVEESYQDNSDNSGYGDSLYSGTYTGLIGNKYRIVMHLNVDGDGDITGRYQYSTSGNQWLTLKGYLMRGAEGYTMHMTEYNDKGEISGSFEMSEYSDGTGFGGTFINYQGKSFDVEIEQQ